MNSVTIIGHVTADPKILTTKNGFEYASFQIAEDQNYRDDNGNWIKNTQFINIRVLRPSEAFKKNVKKGTLVTIVGGQLRHVQYTKDEQTMYYTEIVAGNGNVKYDVRAIKSKVELPQPEAQTAVSDDELDQILYPQYDTYFAF